MLLWRYFGWSLVVSALGLLAVYGLTRDVSLLLVCLVLGFLEVSLSLDNAIINTRILQAMPVVWQKRFIRWGIPIAVFGMRFLFPILLVYAVTPLSFFEVINVAFNHPHRYAEALHHGYPLISAFGGSFLLMVFFHFMFNPHRQVFWLGWLENNPVMRYLTRQRATPAVLTVLVGLVFIHFLFSWGIVIAYLLGVVVYLALHIVSALFMTKALANPALIARVGWMGFIYLEVLDASFSFDGVVGAFAISSHILVIMVGLGIGALFVRSLTVYYVERKTLDRLIYLEHGAYYAIGCLAMIMLLKNFVAIPEWISGGLGLGWLLAALAASMLARQGQVDSK